MHSAWLGAEQLALPTPSEAKACVDAMDSALTLTTALVSRAEESLAGARAADLGLGGADAAGVSALDMDRAVTALEEPAGGGEREEPLAVTPLPLQVTEPGTQ